MKRIGNTPAWAAAAVTVILGVWGHYDIGSCIPVLLYALWLDGWE